MYIYIYLIFIALSLKYYLITVSKFLIKMSFVRCKREGVFIARQYVLFQLGAFTI